MKDQSDVHDVARKNQGQSSTNDQKGTQPEAVSWQFYFILGVLALGVLGLVGKIFGLF
jgi:hypothetical protein